MIEERKKDAVAGRRGTELRKKRETERKALALVYEEGEERKDEEKRKEHVRKREIAKGKRAKGKKGRRIDAMV